LFNVKTLNKNPESAGTKTHEVATVGLADTILSGMLAIGYDTKKDAFIFFECSDRYKWKKMLKQLKLQEQKRTRNIE